MYNKIKAIRRNDMKTGLYMGSFDPFTNGHFEIVKQSCMLFDKVIICIGINEKKQRRFDKEFMQEAIKDLMQEEGLLNVDVCIFDGLAIDKAKESNAMYLVRGIRNSNDYNYEEEISKINEKLGGIKTIYLRGGELDYVSSSLVRVLMDNHKPFSNLVPKTILKTFNMNIK